jgi:hypothetical protein
MKLGIRSIETQSGMCKTLNDAVRSSYILMDVIKESRILGKVGFYNDIQSALSRQRSRFIAAAVLYGGFFMVLGILYTVYL